MSKKRCVDLDNEEEWLPVVGFEGHYEVSNHGRVRSIERKVTDCLGRTRTVKGQPKKTWVDEGGYERVELCKNNTRCGIGVHRLVAKAFKPTEREGVEVMHLDHNPLNNHISNLEWGTHKENVLATHSAGRGSNGNKLKTKCPRGHEYSGVNKRGDRVCHRCRREAQRRYYARKRGKTL